MKKSNITGWRDVFSFTLIQTLKSKAYIISYVILLTLVIVSMPIITIITSKGTKEASGPNPVNKVYVDNKTALPAMDFSGLLKDETLSHITFETMQEDYDVVTKRIEADENASVILTLSENEGMYSLDFVKASKGPVKDSNMQSLGTALVEQFEAFRINTLGITTGQNAMINAAVETTVSMADINGAPITKEDTSISFGEYWFIYGILFAVLMVNMLASTQIATSIVTEKSTRVVEYLLTSVKPLALMVGKIMAMLIAVIIQMVSMVVMLVVSNLISASLTVGNGDTLLSKYLTPDIFKNLNLVNIILCFLLVVLGMIFYATLAGLAGATVSRIEELSEGLMLFTFTNLIGVYVGLGAANILMGSGVNAFVTFTFLFPLSSPFILPGAILVGKASLLIVIAAIILQVLFILLLFQFVAKVYETLILHNGSKIKVSELLKLSKTLSKGVAR